uniref:Tec protein tyrosine kinase n=1 Tax=Cynoglossus semilaevis TaxID=244447 RepID=A0A3P8V6U3_CYNSE
MSSELILEETLTKRSQQKKRTSPLNYKERLFVLTKSSLAYYDRKAEKKFRRGLIELSLIRCVEIVRSNGELIPCHNKYPFQVVHDTNILYIFAPNHDSRTIWVQRLKEEIKDNPSVLAKFHPQFWQEGSWLCCRQMEKQAPGCEKYNPYGDSKKLHLDLCLDHVDLTWSVHRLWPLSMFSTRKFPHESGFTKTKRTDRSFISFNLL